MGKHQITFNTMLFLMPIHLHGHHMHNHPKSLVPYTQENPVYSESLYFPSVPYKSQNHRVSAHHYEEIYLLALCLCGEFAERIRLSIQLQFAWNSEGLFFPLRKPMILSNQPECLHCSTSKPNSSYWWSLCFRWSWWCWSDLVFGVSSFIF